MAALLTLIVLFAVVVLVPLLILKVVLSVFLALVMLPFRLLGAGLKLSGAVVGLVAKVLLAVAGLFVGLIIVPLMPLLLFVGFIWLVVRALEPRRSYRAI